jgi:hypothetical protein
LFLGVDADADRRAASLASGCPAAVVPHAAAPKMPEPSMELICRKRRLEVLSRFMDGTLCVPFLGRPASPLRYSGGNPSVR